MNHAALIGEVLFRIEIGSSAESDQPLINMTDHSSFGEHFDFDTLVFYTKNNIYEHFATSSCQ